MDHTKEVAAPPGSSAIDMGGAHSAALLRPQYVEASESVDTKSNGNSCVEIFSGQSNFEIVIQMSISL